MSPWASIIVVVKKTTPQGSPQQFRLWVDYRKLNCLLPSVTPATGTKKGALAVMPLPKIDELFPLLKGAKYFPSHDLCSGCYHIKLGKESIPKISFTAVFGTSKIFETTLWIITRPRLPHLFHLQHFWTEQDL